VCKAWWGSGERTQSAGMNKHPSTSQLLSLTFMIMVNPIHKQESLALCSRHSQHQHKHMRPYSSFKQSFHLYRKGPCFWQQIISRFEFLGTPASLTLISGTRWSSKTSSNSYHFNCWLVMRNQRWSHGYD
jgi:hypothetical protein